MPKETCIGCSLRRILSAKKKRIRCPRKRAIIQGEQCSEDHATCVYLNNQRSHGENLVAEAQQARQALQAAEQSAFV